MFYFHKVMSVLHYQCLASECSLNSSSENYNFALQGTCSCLGDEFAVHCFCVYASHLGKIHSRINSLFDNLTDMFLSLSSGSTVNVYFVSACMFIWHTCILAEKGERMHLVFIQNGSDETDWVLFGGTAVIKPCIVQALLFVYC